MFLLASVEDRAVGFLRATSLRPPHAPRKPMFLEEIAVLARFRRRGIGTSPVRRLVAPCECRGFPEIFAVTRPWDPAAARLYRGTGAVSETAADRMFVYRLRAPKRGYGAAPSVPWNRAGLRAAASAARENDSGEHRHGDDGR